ncbi:RNA-binding protein Jag [Campylobacter hyointestinalis subsp. hyointestinalis]|uniref:RNA-binding protein Jag n=1 Tax=Campylobacter hyointestinalis subsp. hyointestinalis TaxID=91352 RepID=A0A9W5ATV8_CAMHY|nr:Jag N-terminal domain-containing protein [Campylobacter hyointestinalis]PPB51253.1 hypothetical protein CDQ68_08305 [Campylobacter hyointestinalis subsp. hyointestinalis]PPB52405.1 hypothetical protein CDQ69_07690 [Campylobacter hyointestinalis subsp. hyointestinalis]PPB61151.1 hypothetical protein CDQ72_05500 [Campylobacter hyointestinalis subsp. hyointestinalis]PPB65083.1 hypothetical protein CDQ73_02195 [Campylobacter hyointestinalis subsp. hyointestinalis]PPB65741.1 hypothetical protein
MKTTEVTAPNLEAAYKQAAKELECSVMELDIEILQRPRAGILGMFHKDAIVRASYSDKRQKEHHKLGQKTEYLDRKKDKKRRKPHSEKPIAEAQKEPEPIKQVRQKKLEMDNSIFDTFHKSDENEVVEKKEAKKQNPISQDLLDRIKEGLITIFKVSCYNINVVEVSEFDEDTVFIKLDGEDAALLIGKEGYRYKAVSYILFNWINSKYNLNIRLEIAEFLKNQEAGVGAYLVSVIERVESSGRAQTKPLDGVLVKIALEQLRKRFPDKYVGIKTSDDGRYVIVNDFYKK